MSYNYRSAVTARVTNVRLDLIYLLCENAHRVAPFIWLRAGVNSRKTFKTRLLAVMMRDANSISVVFFVVC